MVGDEAAPLRSYLEITYPMANGQIKNWDEMEILWDYTFHNKLGLSKSDKSDKRVLLTEPALNPRKKQRKDGRDYVREI